MGIYITGDKPANPDHFVSVDPGVKHCGVAIWDPVSKQLRRAFLCDSTKGVHFLQKLPTLDGVVSGVIEIPQRYPGSPVRVEDLVQLTASAMAIVGQLGGHWTQARPGTWTRQWCQDKAIRLERAWKRLTAEEQSRVEMPRAKIRQADVLDAIAIGLWTLKR
jgi:hypothetical protein